MVWMLVNRWMETLEKFLGISVEESWMILAWWQIEFEIESLTLSHKISRCMYTIV